MRARMKPTYLTWSIGMIGMSVYRRKILLVEGFHESYISCRQECMAKSKIYMIRMIIVDEIVVRKRIGMRVFAFGKLACEYFPTYLEMARKLAVEDASAILGTTVKYDILFPSEKTGELPLVGGKIKCGNTELQHVCMADTFMSLDHHARLDGAIAFVCKDLLTGKRVTYFLEWVRAPAL